MDAVFIGIKGKNHILIDTLIHNSF
jgi:hypothetical protein